MNEIIYCELCGVDLELHPFDDPSDDNCDMALRKIELMDQFFRPFGGSR